MKPEQFKNPQEKTPEEIVRELIEETKVPAKAPEGEYMINVRVALEKIDELVNEGRLTKKEGEELVEKLEL